MSEIDNAKKYAGMTKRQQAGIFAKGTNLLQHEVNANQTAREFLLGLGIAAVNRDHLNAINPMVETITGQLLEPAPGIDNYFETEGYHRLVSTTLSAAYKTQIDRIKSEKLLPVDAHRAGQQLAVGVLTHLNTFRASEIYEQRISQGATPEIAQAARLHYQINAHWLITGALTHMYYGDRTAYTTVHRKGSYTFDSLYNRIVAAPLGEITLSTVSANYSKPLPVRISTLDGLKARTENMKQLSGFAAFLDLSGSQYTDCLWGELDLFGADMREMQLLGGMAVNILASQADAQDLHAEQFNVDGVYMTGADLRNAIVVGSRWRAVNLSASDMRGAVIVNDEIEAASFRYTDLRHSKIDDTSLSNVDLTGAVLTGAKIGKVSLFNVKLPDGRLTSNVQDLQPFTS